MEKIPALPVADREKLWLEQKEVVDKITDSLGLGIDEGIKDAIIVLHLLGINTTSSHEGKIATYPLPYIDIASKEGEELEHELSSKINESRSPDEKRIREETDHLYDQLGLIEDKESAEAIALSEQIKRLDISLETFESQETGEVASLRKKIEAENLKEREKVMSLLNQFYENRSVSDEVALIIELQAHGRSRLQSQGHKIQENETDADVKIKRLQDFQEEMRAFVEFMKNNIFKEQ